MNPQANKDLTFVQGETVMMRVDVSLNSIPVNMTGYTFNGQIRSSSGVLLVSFGFDDSMVASGYITALIAAITSATIPAGVHKYDIFATSSTGASAVIAKGSARVEPRVTA